VTDLAIALVALAAIGPLTIWGVRFARRHRRAALAAMSVLLMFGLNFKMDPPPPPRIEAQQHEEEKAEDDEPK
jgi:hypothetical protein